MATKKPTKGRGRPTKYKKEFADLAFHLCLLGATDKQIAAAFDTTEQTVNTWKKKHPDFLESLQKGKLRADAQVARSLYHRALGYEHPEDDIRGLNGEIVITPTIKHYPPDSTAAIFWLKNRQPEVWRDKQIVDNTSSDGSMTPPSRIEIVALK